MNLKFNSLLATILIVTFLSLAPSSLMAKETFMLPEEKTSILDLAKTLSPQQKLELEIKINNIEENDGWKIKVLSQYEQIPGNSIREYWDFDDTTLLIVADPRGGNLLNFNVGDAFFALMPRLFWVELQTRYGNQYYVRDNGEDGAIISTIEAVQVCIEKGG